MLQIDRRQEILEMINKKGSVKVQELAETYNVGKETIRRDLKALEQEWNVTVVYGGAHLNTTSVGSNIREEHITTKRECNAELKHRIAKKAAALIESGDVIALNSGSTTECILNYIGDKTPLSVVTVNVNIAAKAALIPGVEVFMPAGKIRGKSGMIINPEEDQFLKHFTVNKCFFGVSAISLGSQITHPAVEEIANNRTLIAISEKVYLVADHTKYDKNSLYRMARLDEMTGVIVDEPLNDGYTTYLKKSSVELIVAE